MENSKEAPMRLPSKDSLGSEPDIDGLPISEWETANAFNKWTFSIVNPLLDLGMKAPLQYDQLFNIPRADYCGVVMHRLKHNYFRSEPFLCFPRLLVALVRTSGNAVILALLLTLLEGVFRVGSPVLLRYLLLSIQSGAPVWQSYMFASILSLVGFLQVIVHHILFFFTMRVGWNWKNASTAFIHDRLIHLDSGALQGANAGTGMMVNLISNDVQRFEEVTVFGLMTGTSLLEALAVLIIMIFVLDAPSAFAGVGSSFLLLPVTMYFAKKVAQYRGSTAASTDQRVRHISEIITGIASVKSYAWETPFFHMIRALRNTEVGFISKAQLLRSISLGFSFFTPSVVALITFSVFWGSGGDLTIDKVFTTLSLLHVLRFALGRAFTRGVETLSEAVASCRRIEQFISLQPCNPHINFVPNSSAGADSTNFSSAAKQYSTNSLAYDTIFDTPQSSDVYGDEARHAFAHLRSASSMYIGKQAISGIGLQKEDFIIGVSKDPSGEDDIEGAVEGEHSKHPPNEDGFGISSEDWDDGGGGDFDEGEMGDEVDALPADSFNIHGVSGYTYTSPDSTYSEKYPANGIAVDTKDSPEYPSTVAAAISAAPDAGITSSSIATGGYNNGEENSNAHSDDGEDNGEDDDDDTQVMEEGEADQIQKVMAKMGSRSSNHQGVVKISPNCQHPNCQVCFNASGDGRHNCNICGESYCNAHVVTNYYIGKKHYKSLCMICKSKEKNRSGSQQLLLDLMAQSGSFNFPVPNSAEPDDASEGSAEDDGDSTVASATKPSFSAPITTATASSSVAKGIAATPHAAPAAAIAPVSKAPSEKPPNDATEGDVDSANSSDDNDEDDDDEDDDDTQVMEEGESDQIKKVMAKMGSRSSKRQGAVKISPNCQHPNCQTRFNASGDGRHNCNICGESYCNAHVVTNYYIGKKHYKSLCMICKSEEKNRSGSQQLLLDLMAQSGSFNVNANSFGSPLNVRAMSRVDPNMIAEGDEEDEEEKEREAEDAKQTSSAAQTARPKTAAEKTAATIAAAKANNRKPTKRGGAGRKNRDDYDEDEEVEEEVHRVHSTSNYRDMGIDSSSGSIRTKTATAPSVRVDVPLMLPSPSPITASSSKGSSSKPPLPPLQYRQQQQPQQPQQPQPEEPLKLPSVVDSSEKNDQEEEEEDVPTFGVSLKDEDDSPDHRESALISIMRSSYYYGEDSSKPVLIDVSLSVSRGELLVVVGPVGSGKSSLLLAMLGEIPAVQSKESQVPKRLEGDSNSGSGVKDVTSFCYLQQNTRIAYCAQRPWVLAASVRSNIVLAGPDAAMGPHSGDFKNPEEVDLEVYSKAVESTLMVDDFLQWPAYDDTEVGERGISVSGGQKARISLARAVYADADLYILDDPLSAVDAHVGKALMVNCICESLRDQHKAVVLVTHQLQYLEYANKILVLDTAGQQIFYGSYADLQEDEVAMQSLDMCGEKGDDGSAEGEEPMLGVHRADTVPVQGIYRESSIMVANRNHPVHSSDVATTTTAEAVDVKQGARYDAKYRLELRKKLNAAAAASAAATIATSASSVSINQSSSGNNNGSGSSEGKDGDVEAPDPKESDLEKQRRKVVQAEDRAQGTISLAVYWRYLTGAGSGLGILALFLIFISQGALMISEYWLRWWATDSFGSHSSGFYLGIFAALVAGVVLLGVFRALCWFNFTLQAASDLHERCLWAVLHSPLKFFVSNPTGRILNRFAKDQGLTDEQLPITFFLFLETFVYCAAALVLVCIFIPYLAILLPILGYFFFKIRHRYVTSSREIKRMEAMTRSPIYADFSATLDGLITLRAYKLERRVIDMFQKQINDNARAYFSFVLTARWIGFRLDMETAIILMFVCILAVVLRDQVEVGLLGFTLVYTLALSGLFQWMVRQSAEVETQMTSVERIHTYTHLPPEEGYHNTSMEKANREERRARSSRRGSAGSSSRRSSGSGKQQQYQPCGADSVAAAAESLVAESKGHLQLVDLTVTYRPDLDPVLQHFTLDIPAGSKVGICGRTGSGKSSTLLALLRLNIITAGDILLDGESLLQMDLQVARTLVSIIPQDPHLFSGSVRFNLDPFGSHSDEEIWSALGDAHIHEYIRSSERGLDMAVEEGGQNFSVGQRQLLSLARAILRRTKVVLMDEVTASIDFMTDRLIQETIRTSPALRDATIITVAHRLRTIADSSMIVVVQAGSIVEKGAPLDLLQQESSHFKTLAEESNEFEEIYRIASGDQQ